MKKREPLVIEKPKNPGDPKPGEVRNPGGRPAGPNRSTKSAQKVKSTMLQVFGRSPAPHILLAMLSGRTPECFMPRAILDKLKRGELLDDVDDALLKSTNLKNFKWSMDFIAKMIPKQLGGLSVEDGEDTQAGRTKRATVETKSPKVIDMVKKRQEKELYESENE